MPNPVNIAALHHAPHAEDLSICLEAHGFLNQSYDSLDSLLRDLAHSRSVVPDHAAATVELTVTGQPDGFFPFGHLFL
jgi:hypothetical protein